MSMPSEKIFPLVQLGVWVAAESLFHAIVAVKEGQFESVIPALNQYKIVLRGLPQGELESFVREWTYSSKPISQKPARLGKGSIDNSDAMLRLAKRQRFQKNVLPAAPEIKKILDRRKNLCNALQMLLETKSNDGFTLLESLATQQALDPKKTSFTHLLIQLFKLCEEFPWLSRGVLIPLSQQAIGTVTVVKAALGTRFVSLFDGLVDLYERFLIESPAANACIQAVFGSLGQSYASLDEEIQRRKLESLGLANVLFHTTSEDEKQFGWFSTQRDRLRSIMLIFLERREISGQNLLEFAAKHQAERECKVLPLYDLLGILSELCKTSGGFDIIEEIISAVSYQDEKARDTAEAGFTLLRRKHFAYFQRILDRFLDIFESCVNFGGDVLTPVKVGPVSLYLIDLLFRYTIKPLGKADRFAVQRERFFQNVQKLLVMEGPNHETAVEFSAKCQANIEKFSEASTFVCLLQVFYNLCQYMPALFEQIEIERQKTVSRLDQASPLENRGAFLQLAQQKNLGPAMDVLLNIVGACTKRDASFKLKWPCLYFVDLLVACVGLTATEPSLAPQRSRFYELCVVQFLSTRGEHGEHLLGLTAKHQLEMQSQVRSFNYFVEILAKLCVLYPDILDRMDAQRDQRFCELTGEEFTLLKQQYPKQFQLAINELLGILKYYLAHPYSSVSGKVNVGLSYIIDFLQAFAPPSTPEERRQFYQLFVPSGSTDLLLHDYPEYVEFQPADLMPISPPVARSSSPSAVERLPVLVGPSPKAESFRAALLSGEIPTGRATPAPPEGPSMTM